MITKPKKTGKKNFIRHSSNSDHLKVLWLWYPQFKGHVSNLQCILIHPWVSSNIMSIEHPILYTTEKQQYTSIWSYLSHKTRTKAHQNSSFNFNFVPFKFKVVYACLSIFPPFFNPPVPYSWAPIWDLVPSLIPLHLVL